MFIPLGTDYWQSASENLAKIRLRNLYLVANPANPDQFSRVSRPTLTLFADIGDDPVSGIWQQAGTLEGDWLIVSGDTLYRFSPPSTFTELGDLPGEGFPQFTGSSDRVIIVRDGTAYSTDGATITTVLMPDDVPGHEGDPAPVGSATFINGSFLLSVLDSQRFYWILPGDTDPDPLNFASAERAPDFLISVNVINDEIWLLGGEGPEVWSATGDADAPYQRVSGRVYKEGCEVASTVVETSTGGLPCLIWMTNQRTVVIAQGTPSVISNESVEELLKSSTNFRAWSMRHNRHDFYMITCDDFTLAFDINQGTWSRWDSYLHPIWRAHLGTQVGATVYAGDSETGKIWMLEEGISDDGDPIIREVSGWVDNHGKNVPIFSINVRANIGWAEEYEDTPLLEMRWSDDNGFSYSKYVQIPLGEKGQYDRDMTIRSLGILKRPGRTFELRFSGYGRFRLDYATINEV